MTGTNHAMTGGVIGLVIGGPIAIPIAFASHFLLDWMPHLGFEKLEDRMKALEEKEQTFRHKQEFTLSGIAVGH